MSVLKEASFTADGTEGILLGTNLEGIIQAGVALSEGAAADNIHVRAYIGGHSVLCDAATCLQDHVRVLVLGLLRYRMQFHGLDVVQHNNSCPWTDCLRSVWEMPSPLQSSY